MRPIKNTPGLSFWNVGDRIRMVDEGEDGEEMTIIRKWPCKTRKECHRGKNGDCSGNYFDTESERGILTWHDIKDDFRRYYEAD